MIVLNNKSAAAPPPADTMDRVNRLLQYDPTVTKVAAAYSATTAAAARRAYVTTHEPTKAMLQNASMLSEHDIPVTIIGPSGTGKELVARILHGGRGVQAGRNVDNFRAVNCSGIPDALFESILFGHVRGAFTGAVIDAPGLLRSADKGTAFLDEIGDLPLDQQAKLLRAIQSRRVTPVGSAVEFPITCRFVFATHRDLRGMVNAGSFREDLYYRIAPIVLRTYPVTDRPDDAIVIAQAIARDRKWDCPDYVPAAVRESRGNVRAIENWLARVELLGLDPESPEALSDL